jgi:fumarate hydratase class I
MISKQEDRYFFAGDETPYRLLTSEHVEVRQAAGGKEFLEVRPEALREVARAAFHEVSFFFRSRHLQGWRDILGDPEASANDRFVAHTLLQNAVIAALGRLPSCQDTGTALIAAKRGHLVLTDGRDHHYLAEGIKATYHKDNLRYSQIAPVSMFEERNTGTNLPAGIDISLDEGDVYRFLFMAKGGGSANRTMLFQQNRTLLNEKSLQSFLEEKLPLLGTGGCPPYHLGIVIGGLSAEDNLKTLKLATAGELDHLAEAADGSGTPYRDRLWEQRVIEITRKIGLGAQYGGKYMALDARVIRLVRHAASLPVSIGISCSADRHIKGLICRDGVFLEQLEHEPLRYLAAAPNPGDEVSPVIDLDRPMDEVCRELAAYPVGSRLTLSGTLIVARDIAHAKIAEILAREGRLPDYFKNHPIFYAGPAKTPEGMASGSMGPTTAGRMDPYLPLFMAHGGSRITIAKGNRSSLACEACRQYCGFYLGSIGGAAAILAEENIVAMEVVDFPELGMEAVRKIKVKEFPVILVSDNQGNDLFSDIARRRSADKG